MLSSRDSRVAGRTKHSEEQQAYSVIRKQLIILGTVFSGAFLCQSLAEVSLQVSFPSAKR